MKGFLCEPTLEGVFTGIYDIWADREKADHKKLFLEGEYEPELFFDYLKVEPDSKKAEKVARSVRGKISPLAYRWLCLTALSYAEDRADAAYRFLIRGFQTGCGITDCLQEPEVARVFELSRKTTHEAHQFREFIRFEQLSNGSLFARIAPKCRVATLLAPHFADRFSGENWMIFDESHGEAVLHRRMEQWWAASLSTDEAEAFRERYAEPDGYTGLWQTFVDSIAIEQRKNPDCQRNLFPKWMRKYATEQF